MKFLCSNQKVLAQTAIDHDANHIQRSAAVTVAFATSKAFTAIHIRFDAAFVAHVDVRHTFADRQDFNAQFVTNNQWIVKERHLPQKAAVVCSADAHPVGANQSLTWTRRGGFGDVDVREMLGLFQLNGFHGDSSYVDVFR